MSMRLRSTAPESTLVHVCETDTRPLCPYCGEPVNTEELFDPKHDPCWEIEYPVDESWSLLEVWAAGE